jgi:hypothetical protein
MPLRRHRQRSLGEAAGRVGGASEFWDRNLAMQDTWIKRSKVSTDELVRAGILRAPERTGWQDFWSMPRPVASKSSALQALLDERRDGR